jgi:DNA-binding NarL/FixJ family response regulator
MIRLFVIDDNPIVIDGLNYLFHLAQDDIGIVGSALNVHEAVQKIRQDDFDIFILDLYIPDSHPPENVRTLRKRFPGKKIIIFTTESSYLWVRAMIKEGVDGYLTKDLIDSQVKSAIYKVFNGESVFPFAIAEKRTTPGLGNHECDYPLQSNQQKII